MFDGIRRTFRIMKQPSSCYEYFNPAPTFCNSCQSTSNEKLY